MSATQAPEKPHRERLTRSGGSAKTTQKEAILSGPVSAYEAMLAPLIAKRDQLSEEMRAVEAAIAALRSAQQTGSFDAVPVPSGHEAESGAPRRDEEARPATTAVFARMSQPQAVYEVIRRAGEALVAKTILEVLRAAGSAPSGSDPVKKIQVALNRRVKSHGDVIHVGWGEWGLKEWYSDEEIEKSQALIDGANARDKREHRRRMKEGIRKLQQRGAHYGKPPKITPEQWALALNLISEGETMISAIYREIVKLTPPGEKPMVSETLRKNKKALFDNEPYPARWQAYFDNRKPSALSHEDEKRSIRVVK